MNTRAALGAALLLSSVLLLQAAQQVSNYAFCIGDLTCLKK